jgi:hypothetical protein
MKMAADYQRRAQKCRYMANRLPECPERNQLLKTAASWDSLAEQRLSMVQRFFAMALNGYLENEGVYANVKVTWFSACEGPLRTN